MEGKLNQQDFLNVIKNTPLFSIDLVIVNEKREVLYGLRKNKPARGWWFVPGGRIYKNETLDNAFRRISAEELDFPLEIEAGTLLGLFEHLYENSIADAQTSTHYINAPYLVFCQKHDITPPLLQHSSYRWVAIENIQMDPDIHCYSKTFVEELKGLLYD